MAKSKEGTSRRRPEVDSGLRELFAWLLFTWPVHISDQETLQFKHTLKELANDAERSTLLEDLEQRHGDGHYADRRLLLEDLVKRLETDDRVHLATVFDVLRDAKQAYDAEHVQRKRIVARRERDEEERLVRQMKRLAVRLRVLLRKSQEIDPFRDLAAVEMVRALDDFDRAATKRMGRTRGGHRAFDDPGPKRRATRGRPPMSWLGVAREDLARAGVVDPGARDDLLMAVGVTPYRTPPGPEA